MFVRLKKEQCNEDFGFSGSDEYYERVESELNQFEYFFPIRLSDETFRGLLDFIKGTETGAPMKQVREAMVRQIHLYKIDS